MLVGFVVCLTSGLIMGAQEAKRLKLEEEEKIKNAGIAFKADD